MEVKAPARQAREGGICVLAKQASARAGCWMLPDWSGESDRDLEVLGREGVLWGCFWMSHCPGEVLAP